MEQNKFLMLQDNAGMMPKRNKTRTKYNSDNYYLLTEFAFRTVRY